MALDAWESEICGRCGNPRSVCSDPSVPWFPQATVCWARAAQEVAIRAFNKKHGEAKPDTSGYLPTDGRSIWVSTEDLEPDGDFLAG